MGLKFKKAAIVVKPHKDVISYLKKTIDILTGFGVKISLEKHAADLLDKPDGISRERVANDCQIIILIGGDGTFLSIARSAVINEIPVAGFNLGRLGFLTELNKDLLKESLHELFYHGLRISTRKTLEIQFKGTRYIALNDVVASKGNIARTINLLLEIENSKIAEIRGDGLIISTPTGSTAYSLSAGGPIVTPDVNGLVITPICAHTLTFRPIVIPDSSKIKVQLLSSGDGVFITVDGQQVIPMEPGDFFEVRTFPKELKMVHPKSMNYFRLLHEKLNWSL